MKPVAIILSILTLVIGSSAVAAEDTIEPLASVPFEIDYEGWITIKTTVNGKGPYDFIVDTGATLTLAFENLSGEQSFQPSPLPPRRILGLSSILRAPVTEIGDIDIGGEMLSAHIGVVLSDWEAPRKTPQGVLGLDFLSRYLVIINQDTKRIEFYPSGAAPEKIKKWTTTSLKRETFGQDVGALYTIEAKVNNRPFPFIVDLGAAGTIINYPLLRNLFSGIRLNESRIGGASSSSRLNDINDNQERARLVRVQRIKIGRVSWRKPTLLVYNAAVFSELGIANDPYGLFGADLLRDKNFAFDFASERFYIERPPRR